LRNAVRVEAGDVAALVADRAAARRREAGDRAQRGGLAGAVSTEQGHHFAFVHAQGKTVQDVPEAVVRIDIVELQDQAATPPR
jgi:hypothetical protein